MWIEHNETVCDQQMRNAVSNGDMNKAQVAAGSREAFGIMRRLLGTADTVEASRAAMEEAVGKTRRK